MNARYAVRAVLLLALHATCWPPGAARADAAVNRGPLLLQGSPLSGVGESVTEAFTGWRLALQLGAVAATAGLALSGADGRVHDHFVRHDALGEPTEPVIYFGFLAPVALGGTLAAFGWLGESQPAWTAGSAVLQALLLAGAYQTLLKAVVGRAPPAVGGYADSAGSREFRFGLLRGGVDYGWPSGLMLMNAAVVTALWPVLPSSWAVRAGGVLYLALLALSTLPHDRAGFDWLSDTVAGTLLGVAIGAGVGNTFAARASGEADRPIVIRPTFGRVRGLSVAVAF